jgi:hypothetical protein
MSPFGVVRRTSALGFRPCFVSGSDGDGRSPPQATIVALKACTIIGFCFADSVAAALRYAGDK